jgi:aminopeptidase N
MYYKGGNMLHTIRQLVGDDEKWRGILRGLSATFRHQTVTGRQIEEYIGREAGLDLRPVFAQYLETTKVPVLEYRVDGAAVAYRWADVVPGFAMPVRASIGGGAPMTLHPTTAWQTAPGTSSAATLLTVDENYYVLARRVDR